MYQRPLVLALSLSALWLPGCQSGGDNAPAAPAAPPTAASATAQESNSAVEALSVSASIATDAIMSTGSGQTVTTSDSESAATTKSVSQGEITSVTTSAVEAKAASAGFTFATSGTVTVNLDELTSGGADRYPNASGTFSVVYDSSGNGGPVVGSPVGSAGIVAYTVTVTALTDCIFTDPRCSAATTIISGASYSYDVEVVWNWTDANHWTLHSDVDLVSSGLSGTGTRPGVTWTASLSGSRHAVTGLTYTAGTLAITRTVVADWTVNTVRNGTPHTVVWHRPELDRIFVTVDGTTYGPYTVGQVWWYWNVSCH